jgi:hypothetical protein
MRVLLDRRLANRLKHAAVNIRQSEPADIWGTPFDR